MTLDCQLHLNLIIAISILLKGTQLQKCNIALMTPCTAEASGELICSMFLHFSLTEEEEEEEEGVGCTRTCIISGGIACFCAIWLVLAHFCAFFAFFCAFLCIFLPESSAELCTFLHTIVQEGAQSASVKYPLKVHLFGMPPQKDKITMCATTKELKESPLWVGNCKGGEHRRGESSETFLERRWVLRSCPGASWKSSFLLKPS